MYVTNQSTYTTLFWGELMPFLLSFTAFLLPFSTFSFLGLFTLSLFDHLNKKELDYPVRITLNYTPFSSIYMFEIICQNPSQNPMKKRYYIRF